MAWQTHLADYEIASPFPQLERPVIAVKDDERGTKLCRDYDGTSLNAMTFRSRAEKLGWTRGSVADGGGVDAYRKVFPAQGSRRSSASMACSWESGSTTASRSRISSSSAPGP